MSFVRHLPCGRAPRILAKLASVVTALLLSLSWREAAATTPIEDPPAGARSATEKKVTPNPGVLYASIGLGGGYLHDVGPAGDSASGSGHLGGVLFALGDSRFVSFAWMMEGLLGAGSDGLFSMSRLSLEIGGRLPLHDDEHTMHGLFLRGGIGARSLASDSLSTAAIDLPAASAGYSTSGRSLAIQLGVRVAPTVFGRYSIGDAFNHEDARRRFEVAPTYGAFASVHVGPMHVDGWASRSVTSGTPGTPVDYVNGTACFSVFVFGLCSHAMYTRVDVSPQPSTLPWVRSEAFYVGGTAVVAFDSTGLSTFLPAFLRPRRGS
jgi:hypothetical protein